MTFPRRNAPPRTDANFRDMSFEEHHHDETVLKNLDIDLVCQFPLDYMHLVCLGIMKKLFALWINGPLNVRIGGNMTARISDSIIGLGTHLPREFLRKGTSGR